MNSDPSTVSRPSASNRATRQAWGLGRLGATVAAFAALAGASTVTLSAEAAPASVVAHASPTVHHRTVEVEGLEIFYREAGPADAPTILLLHGFPTSSHMFRNLIPALADRYRVVAPDYPGYGQSEMPSRAEFEYSFDNLARVVDAFTHEVGVDEFVVYLMDYGAPIGYRLASAQPERIQGMIVQNGNAYDEGLDNPFWEPIKQYWADPTPERRDALAGLLTIGATEWQYTHGVRDVTTISPDNWVVDQARLDCPGNKDIQLDLFLSYGTNPPLYPEWQAYFRDHQPPTLIVWGTNDQIFPAAGAAPYLRDLTNVDYNLLETGHFALEEDGAVIAEKIRAFMEERVVGSGE